MVHIGHLFTNEADENIPETEFDPKSAYLTLKRQVERLWNHEREMEVARLRNMSSKPLKTMAQVEAEILFKNTVRLVNGGYEVGLIWKKGRSVKDLPDNFEEAKQIFLSQEKRFKRDPRLREEYVKICLNWIKEESFVEIPRDSLGPGFYIPHFMVIRLDKTTTKYRLVMHGAMEFQGTSINDHLECGSNQIANLLHVLLRMRRGRFVLTGDVEAMFMRIRVKVEDCPALRILFRGREQDQIRILEGRKHLFGLACSPFVAVMTMKHHAKENQARWPLAHDVVMEHMMVDDFLISADTLEELETVNEQMKALCHSMGMKIHKHAANHFLLLQGLDEAEIAKTVEIRDSEDRVSPDPDLPNIKTLGMLWLPGEDVFCFQWEPVQRTGWTKREVCSVAGRLFDPLGLVAPVTILGKLIVQELWRRGVEWDDPIPSEVEIEWESYLQHLNQVGAIRVPRWIGHRSVKSAERLVAFADASLVAQAAVVYGVRCQEDGFRISRLLCSKTKVSPLRKQETVARLELQAALMAVELTREVGIAFKLDLNEPLFFTDSTTVLWWLRSTKALPVFVANRVTKILDGSDVGQWRHVRTHENPADLPTRGVVPWSLIEEELWWNEPPFLLTEEREWPEQPEIKETAAALSEVRKLESHLGRLHLHAEVRPVFSPFQKTLLCRLGRFSSLRRGIRALANIRCFLRRRRGLPHDEGV